MNILSIQSSVAFGHVGNSAAVFPLQRLGHEVWPINSVQFSNHTGYGAWRGMVFPPEHLSDLVEGIAERGVLGQCNAVLSGYLGDAASGAVILNALERVKAQNPDVLYCCDPVMGDEGRGLFVRPGIPEFFATRALPHADIVTPNQFELEVLAGTKVSTLDEVVKAARSLRAQGPKMVAVTSVRAPAADDGMLGSALISADGAWLAQTPLINLDPPRNGTGDVFASLFLGHLLSGVEPPEALRRTVAALFAILERTSAANSRELLLIAAQDEFVEPTAEVKLTRLY